MPPIFLSTHSLASMIPLSVLTKIHSPTALMPLMRCASLPLTICPNSSALTHIRFVGFDSIFIFRSTGSPSQYFIPSHSLLLARFSWVTISESSEDCWRCDVDGAEDGGRSFAGGEGPPRFTEERKPCFCRCRERDRWNLERGTEVRPRRAREAFWRWEQTCERLTRDIFGRVR